VLLSGLVSEATPTIASSRAAGSERSAESRPMSPTETAAIA
jgi:hypothetical protein